MRVVVPFGPHHPALHEPEHFTFEVDGEVVVGVRPRIGYVHRGIEKLAESKTWIQNLYLVERVCGICNVSHTLCYVEAVEDLIGLEPPKRAKYLRLIAHELNRLHSHLLWLGVMAELMGYHTLFMYTWRDRELVMDLMEELTGNRLLSAYNKIGGVSRDVGDAFVGRLLRVLDRLDERFRLYVQVAQEDPTILARTQGVGTLDRESAVKYCVVGPVARASGLSWDVRVDRPYAAYDEVPYRIVTRTEGDVWARLMVRVEELLAASESMRHAATHLPDGPIRYAAPRKMPEGEGVGVIEAPRGELLYHVISDGKDKPYRLKIRTPTLA
ncbi:MAG TPA: NADH dehydrogenase subunit, partial [Candidatus Korarchaeota archaeon]|nr:NADH dehydrogenase subunit [Candidatus Korarchaeota archaeon]